MRGDGTPVSTNPKGARQRSRRGERKRKASQLLNEQPAKKRGKVLSKIEAVIQDINIPTTNNIQLDDVDNTDLSILPPIEAESENPKQASTNADSDNISTNVEVDDNNEHEIIEDMSVDKIRLLRPFEDSMIDERNVSEKVVEITKNIR